MYMSLLRNKKHICLDTCLVWSDVYVVFFVVFFPVTTYCKKCKQLGIFQTLELQCLIEITTLKPNISIKIQA